MQIECERAGCADAEAWSELEEETCDVIPIDRARGVGRAADLTWLLESRLAMWDLEETFGPHVVIAFGDDVRCFGPYGSRAVALAVATAEAREWEREFPDNAVFFEVAPLLQQEQVAP